MSLPDVYIRPVECGGMYVSQVLALSDTSMTFDGHFYDAQNDRMFPECILYRTDTHQRFHIEITSYKEIEDTSEAWTDEEEGGRICLFPTHIITVTWRVIAELHTKEEVSALSLDLQRRRKEFRRKLDAAEAAALTPPASDDDANDDKQ
jgi:hypothetical protein